VTLGDDGMPARVQSAEFLGADTVVTCMLGNQALTVRVAGKVSVGPGATVRVGWRPEHAHFFDAMSGLRRDDVLRFAVDEAGSFVQVSVA
jgi:sn-glycerol 3-phosphate transport system ATP-binding protein